MARTEEDERNIKNNANIVNNAADVAIASGHPVAVGAGEAVKVGDKLTGGKVSEGAGKALNNVNKHSPMGKHNQNMFNKASESGFADKAGKAARMKNGQMSKGSDIAKEPTGKNNMFETGRGQNMPSSNANTESKQSNGRNIAGLSPFGKKNANGINQDNNKNNEDESLFGQRSSLAKKIMLILPIIMIVTVLLICVSIMTISIAEDYDDGLGAATVAGEDLGTEDELTEVSEEANKYYERINDVKNSFMDDGKYFDTTQIIAVYKVIMSDKRSKIDYDDISKREIKKVANAMFDETTYDEELFRENLKTDIIPNYINNISEDDAEEMVDEIFDYIDEYYEYIEKDDSGNTCTSAGSCSYNITGFSINGKNIKKQLSIDNLKVRLMQCGSPYGNGSDTKAIDQDMVDFENYVAGVVYAEIGDSYPTEAIKAQAVMARSYALARPTAMNNTAGKKLAKENGQWVLQIASCVSDQVFCNIDQGCSYMGGGDGQGGYVVSGTNAKGSIKSKKALSSGSNLRSAVQSTKGELLVNNQGYVISTGYTSEKQTKIKELAEAGYNYKEILFKLYSNANDIDSSSCSGSCTPSSGEYANWKQCDSRWANTKLGNTTICKVGCLATSISILIAKSGVETTLSNFNPGTFVTRMGEVGGFIGNNLAYNPVSKIAPKFVYQNQISVAGMTREQKLDRIKTLTNQGYYLAVEVKGNTGQHWVAVDNVNGNTINMMDPASKSTNMWEQYSWKNTSLINVFKVES